ncbi:ATP-dependent nuclease [Macrococcoides caseolyticum]|uniref:ATP-dependent nuclease n=1 Tax=Macrococcoides caseolyticum TaxID=69966 RepID=UPI000C322B81|nr:AAA family ATPase [Macrococcus caseolyticus]PKE62347.1 ATP/GTP-binding protein [Macrococcus caseolyticus]PKF44669.1 ATP/GTP-binding protein [Macrococcus caseolyticus]
MKGIEFYNYKTFKNDEFVGISEFKKINVIIGKNNIGKSAMLDSIKMLRNIKSVTKFNEKSEKMKLYFELTEDLIEKYFDKHISTGGYTYYEYGMFLSNKVIQFEFQINNSTFNSYNIKLNSDKEECQNIFKMYNRIYEEKIRNLIDRERDNWFNSKSLILDADRNLVPEKAQNSDVVKSNGEGATNLVRIYLNKADKDESRISNLILNSLNEILHGEYEFTGISIQEIDYEDQPFWEIFLVDQDKKVSVSDSGSGLRTILLVLIKLFLEYNENVHKFIIFEELENNLHPQIQRNLFNFVFKWIEDKKSTLFLTTHSSVPINYVTDNKNSQLLHVYKDNNITKIKRIFSFIGNDYLFRDLDIRASDLLQTNGIIWVEGPSDRIYLNKWIEIMSKGKLIEDKHYQIMFYGGRLLSHLTGKTKDSFSNKEEENLISLLLTNRNSAILIDSDKRKKGARLNNTKTRIKNEFKENGKFVWITKGKEIENYLSREVLKNTFEIDDEIGQYETIKEVIDRNSININYDAQKVKYSRQLVENIELETMNVLDLEKQIKDLVEEIRVWNNL